MRFKGWEARLGGWKQALVVDLAVSLLVGCLFFALDNLVRKWISKTKQHTLSKKQKEVIS